MSVPDAFLYDVQFLFDWNRNFLRRSMWKEGMAVLQYNAIMLLVVNLLMTMMKWADVFSRLVLMYFLILNILLSFLIHMIIKKAMHTYYSSGQNVVKVLVVTQSNLIDETLTGWRRIWIFFIRSSPWPVWTIIWKGKRSEIFRSWQGKRI